MNRTKEFLRIVQSTNFPQKPLKPSGKNIKDLFEVDKVISTELDNLKAMMKTNKIYETFRIESKLDELKEKIYNYKSKLNIEIPSNNPQEIESFTNLINILRSRANKNTLKINELIRKKEENKNKSKNRRNSFINEDENKDFNINNPNINVNNRSSLDVQSIEEEQSNNIRHRDRDVITNQISEIGEIMEEIGIHVSMQEESFKRIDDLMSRAPAATEPSSRPVLPPQFFKFQLFEILRVGSVDFIYKSAPAGFEPARASTERYYRPLS
ncbi:syntaxin like protein [Nosema bombycis CQ1]|uniref:Syntaxin like protein n=2 Tax=Nosema bombycis TaxID=27978 RepID=R0KTD1_NOSB1|nr:unknown [Nosema bombycis]EOB13482.1 syntaxin like protein [Nosema bombycis CQ1]|eukprot:EOB13482.1 syntaxin like protein [Nosema bombycis CQ1]